MVSGVLGIRDGWMGVIGAVSRMVGSLCYAFVTSPDLAWLMWMGECVPVQQLSVEVSRDFMWTMGYDGGVLTAVCVNEICDCAFFYISPHSAGGFFSV